MEASLQTIQESIWLKCYPLFVVLQGGSLTSRFDGAVRETARAAPEERFQTNPNSFPEKRPANNNGNFQFDVSIIFAKGHVAKSFSSYIYPGAPPGQHRRQRLGGKRLAKGPACHRCPRRYDLLPFLWRQCCHSLYHSCQLGAASSHHGLHMTSPWQGKLSMRNEARGLEQTKYLSLDKC